MRTGPDYIQFYPTLRCNRSCGFCFNKSMPRMEDMALTNFTKMLDVLGTTSAKTIDIMGGEPTMHPDIVRIVETARDYRFSVNISSNGTNLEVLAEIMKIGEEVTVGISINDQQTLMQVRSFIQKHRPVVKSVYSPALSRGMIEEILFLRPKRYHLIYRDTLDKHELGAAVPFDQFLSSITQRFSPLQAGMVYCSGFLPDRANHPKLKAVRCPAGTKKLGVMPDGSVYPCNLFFGRKEFLLGNLFTDPFEKIWRDDRLAFFRAKSENACPKKSCILHAKCRGGCPAHGLLITGDLAAPDPRCGNI